MRSFNLSRVTKGPHKFTVIRSTGEFVIGGNGWNEGTPKEFEVDGLATPTSSKDINQLPEGDRITESYTFYTDMPLNVTHADGEAGTSDKISYNGSTYKLVQIRSFLSFGYNKAVGVRLAGD